MEHLYAPWRSSYVKEESRGKQETTTAQDCVFCAHIKEDDAQAFILYRGSAWYVIMNLFPYNPGHLLIVPYDHISTLTSIPLSARHELADLTHSCLEILGNILQPQGFNVGINMGKAAGAGIPAHIHQHVLPRWFGDTNFLPVLAETKHISCDLNDLYKNLREAFCSYFG